MPLFLLSLLGFGKGILGDILGLFKKALGGFIGFAGKHPLLTVAIIIDLVLLWGCWWGYRQHNHYLAEQTKVTQLQTTVKQDKSLIDTLYERIKEYAAALSNTQNELNKTIQENNAAIDRLKKAADQQIARQQEEAAKARQERDYYIGIAQQYRGNPSKCGPDPAQRIACEEKLNAAFIRAMQRVKK